jgi:hypothetical protein
MKIFSILKVHDEYSLKHYPLDRLRLNPTAVPVKKSGTPTYPLDRVTFVLTRGEYFKLVYLIISTRVQLCTSFASFYTSRI